MSNVGGGGLGWTSCNGPPAVRDAFQMNLNDGTNDIPHLRSYFPDRNGMEKQGCALSLRNSQDGFWGGGSQNQELV